MLKINKICGIVALTGSLVMWVCLAWCQQTLVDDFEAGILDDWTFLLGNAQVDDSKFITGQHSVRLFKSTAGGADGQSLILRKNFSGSYGRYRVYCQATGFDSDVHFLFQYIDERNYYAIGCNPRFSDNPQLLLYKVIDGAYTELAMVDPAFSLGGWFRLDVERACQGAIDVSINDTLRISVIDQDIKDDGSIVLGAWGESSYFDSLSFRRDTCEQVTEIQEVLCSGGSFAFGEGILFETGSYYDTLQTVHGFDSIIHLELNIKPHYLVTEPDTICWPEVYYFGEDTLRTSGLYSQSLKSTYGCDSIVELKLVVLGGDTTFIDTLLCEGGSVLFNGQERSEEGIYYDSLITQGCLSLIGLRLQILRPMLDLGADQTVCFEDEGPVELSIPGFDSVLWSDGSNQATISIRAPGTYDVEAYLDGCQSKGSIHFINACEEEMSTYYIPNAFSPNGDQVNDVFVPAFIQEPSTFRLRIFNRWGGLLFESNDARRGWDGQVDGEVMDTGVYLYAMEIDGQVESGTVTIVGFL